MIEAVVFDLDGVLVDSEPVWEQVRRRVVADYGGHWDADTQDRLMGMSTGEWSAYLSSGLGVRLSPPEVGDWLAIQVTGFGDGESEAKALAARLSLWSFAIAPERAKLLRMTLSDFVVPRGS